MPPTPSGDDPNLEDQVKRLTRTVVRLQQAQETLDADVSLRRHFYELGQRIYGSFSLLGILQQIPSFATRVLGYERAVVLLDDRNVGTFTVRTFDGYSVDEQRKRVNATVVSADAALSALLRAEKIVVYGGSEAQPDLAPLADSFGMASFTALPLVGSTKSLMGLLVAGNAEDASRAEARRPGNSIQETRERGSSGLTMLAEQAGWAIDNCILHWEVAIERNLLEAKISERTEELRRAYEQIQEDLEQARVFQKSILESPPPMPGIEVELIYRPCGLVGGDLYDVEAFADGTILAFIADATGHGVDAALTTMFIKSAYDLVKRGQSDPAELLRALNDSIAGHYGRLQMRFTAACALIDLGRRRVTYASAGHPASCLGHGKEVSELGGGGPFIGIIPDMQYPSWEVPFQPDDAIYLFTDGIFEVWNGEGVLFGEEKVYAAISRASETADPVGATVCAELQRYTGDRALEDDLTFVGIRWKQAT